jgi:23S rRNA pseudouridine2604 synthase
MRVCCVQVDEYTFRIRLQEGRNRQIRKMCEALGFRVQDLHRHEIAGISLKGLQVGQWKALNDREMVVVNSMLNESI